MKNNPHAVTLEMLGSMERNPRMEWASKSFKILETASGVKIVAMSNDETTDAGRKNVQPASSNVDAPMVKFEQAKLNMLTMLLALSKSIPPGALKDMTVKDRIAAFDKLMNTATKIMTGVKPMSVVFNQINVNKAGRQDLESAIMAYASGTEPVDV